MTKQISTPVSKASAPPQRFESFQGYTQNPSPPKPSNRYEEDEGDEQYSPVMNQQQQQQQPPYYNDRPATTGMVQQRAYANTMIENPTYAPLPVAHG
ncbi:hypothetical protein COB52_05540 [Candidatus Kaiserbacteria bacterium]|nr:MAG: hypothetical protein COB52_05540 [Candidatus Kaiserbacteria bacterium]